MSGGFLMRFLLVAAAAVSCTLLIRGKTPALAWMISLAALLALLGMLLPKLQTLRQAYVGLVEQVGIQSALFTPVMKVLAITQITHIAAELCRDAGEKAVAAQLELCGAVASALCVIPLAEQALTLIGALGT